VPCTGRDRTGPLASLANLVFGVFALGHGMADIRLTLGAHGNGFSPLVVGAPHSVTFRAGEGRPFELDSGTT
jgi:hypothetical protein